MTQEETKEFRTILKAFEKKFTKEFDSLHRNLDVIGKDVELIKTDVGSIKKGVESIEKIVSLRERN